VTIYIYGSKSFKTTVHEILDHANIKFRLQEGDGIKDVSSLSQIKKAIEQNPNDIFLIDDDKIIKKSALHDKIKFLKPKDGIEEEYLKDHGIGDMSVNDIDDLASHVIKRLEQNNQDEMSLDEYENINANSNEEYLNSICKANEKLKQTSSDSKYDNFDIDEVIDYLQEHPEIIEQSRLKNYIQEDYEPKGNPNTKQENEDEDFDFDENDFDFDEDEFNTQEPKEEPNSLHEDDFGLTVQAIDENENQEQNTPESEPQKQENDMSDSFSELDDLNEDEVLAALNDTDVSSSQPTQSNNSASSNQVELNSNSVNDIASLITQLLNNKTLEITIKIKE
jgi:hypothetical protein